MKDFTLNGKEFNDRVFVLSCSVLFELNFRLRLAIAHISQFPHLLYALAFIVLCALFLLPSHLPFIVSSFLLCVLSLSYAVLL